MLLKQQRLGTPFRGDRATWASFTSRPNGYLRQMDWKKVLSTLSPCPPLTPHPRNTASLFPSPFPPPPPPPRTSRVCQTSGWKFVWIKQNRPKYACYRFFFFFKCTLPPPHPAHFTPHSLSSRTSGLSAGKSWKYVEFFCFSIKVHAH